MKYPVPALLAVLFSVLPSFADEPKTEVLEGRGSVVPVKRVTITSAVPGQVAEVLVQPGQRVKRGDILFRLERISQELDVKKAEIALQAARVRLAQLKAGPREEVLKIARAEVAVAEANLKQTEIILVRLRKLRDTGGVPLKEVDQAEAGARSAQAMLDKQRATLTAAEKGEPTDAARLAVDAAEIELERTKVAANMRIVHAPFDGVILRVGTEVGSFTNPGMIGLANAASLCELADVSAALVEVTLPESVYGQLTLGTKCEASLSVFRGKKLPGTIERIGPTIDPIRNTFTVRVRLTTTETLPIGASALVRFAPKQ